MKDEEDEEHQVDPLSDSVDLNLEIDYRVVECIMSTANTHVRRLEGKDILVILFATQEFQSIETRKSTYHFVLTRNPFALSCQTLALEIEIKGPTVENEKVEWRFKPNDSEHYVGDQLVIPLGHGDLVDWGLTCGWLGPGRV
ncbi:hypothetical protein Syun_003727 [Stephania yunnanensis]|uniref:Uncharacterized protein n=1 Tax=Stephania yunnanensis TaxID=152371 RepID=A0AAP0L4A9_9MAGN